MVEIIQEMNYQDLLKSALSELGLEDYYKKETAGMSDDIFYCIAYHGIRENKRFLGFPVGRTIADIVSEANVPEDQRVMSRLPYDVLQINVRDSKYLPLIEYLSKRLESELKQKVRVKWTPKLKKSEFDRLYDLKYDNVLKKINLEGLTK